jgi:cyclopropane fatty-acyl-phospholipid synthase-like methyltransferase
MASFDEYKRMASDASLAPYEKVGFAAVHRKDSEKNIFPDVLSKLPVLSERSKTVVDIGCGCSKPALDLVRHCEAQGHNLVLVDSEEMLSLIPDTPNLDKRPHKFPEDPAFLGEFAARADCIITYSVLHVICPYQNSFTFLDKAVSLLRPGGQMLVGDIPNISRKKRFLSSEKGAAFHREWSETRESPEVSWIEDYEEIDDSVVLHLLLRYRSMGMQTYLLPQGDGLPMNHTREDILICRL